MRKLRSYLHWLKIHETREDEPSEQEAPYLAIQNEGKDKEIQDIFSSYEEQRKQMQQEREKLAPSYYYLAYPEAYAFN